MTKLQQWDQAGQGDLTQNTCDKSHGVFLPACHLQVTSQEYNDIGKSDSKSDRANKAFSNEKFKIDDMTKP